MADLDCTTDPTIVACTGEDLGREYDQPAPTTEIGTAVPWTPPTEGLAHTGAGTAPGLALALLLVVVGAVLRRVGTRG